MKFNGKVLILSVLMASCASHYRSPESIQEKMARYNPKSDQTKMIPEIAISKDLLNTRLPASETPIKKERSDLSNKRLYFLTLFQQYNDLKEFSDFNSPTIQYCPNFHTQIVDYSFVLNSKTHPNKTSIEYKNSNFLTQKEKYPELFLTLAKDDKIPTVIEYFNQNKNSSLGILVKKAIDIHVDKTYNELSELCEFGSSDNYYAFENLAGFVNTNKKFSQNEKNLKSLMKTTLFSNKAIISSLNALKDKKERGPASLQLKSDFFDQVVSRLGVEWSKSYFFQLENK